MTETWEKGDIEILSENIVSIFLYLLEDLFFLHKKLNKSHAN